MVTAKQAVAAASGFLVDLIAETPELRLEQVSPLGPNWGVVLSFKTEVDYQSIFNGAEKRVFKSVTMDRESGEPQSMTMWKV